MDSFLHPLLSVDVPSFGEDFLFFFSFFLKKVIHTVTSAKKLFLALNGEEKKKKAHSTKTILL